MKKYLCVLLLLFFCFGFSSPHHRIIARKNAVASPTTFCDSCPDAAKGGDVLCEEFEGSEFSCSSPAWTQVTDSGTIDGDNTPTGSWTCTDTDTRNLEVATSGGTYASIAAAAEIAHSYGLFYFKVTAEAIPNENEAEVFYTQSDSFITSIIRLSQDGSGNLFFEIGHRQDDNSFSTYYDVGASEGTPDTYTLGQEVRVRWDADTTATSGTATYYVRVAANPERTIAFSEDETDDSEGYRYFRFGYELDDSDLTIEINNFKVDDDTIPSLCGGDS